MTPLRYLLVTTLISCRIAVSVLAFSVGQAIQSVSTAEDGLKVAADFWLPSDSNLPAHYRQAVHHETRQRWASQLIEKIFFSNDVSLNLQDSRLERVVQAAAIPYGDDSSKDRINKEGTWILTSLQGIHGIVSRKLDVLVSLREDSEYQFSPETLQAIELLVERGCALSDEYSLDQACQLLWSVQGLYARLPELQQTDSLDHVKKRVDDLPFEIIPRGLDWLEISKEDPSDNPCDDLIHDIPFSKDTIITRRGESVKERRGTAWIAQQGIGNLAYSGKLMSPKPIPETVIQVMRGVEDALNLGTPFFDCALCNHYADATAACKFHTDPEHGTLWHRTTVVVAAGSDRKFAFKPIDTKWQDWDPLEIPSNNHNMAAAIHLFAGDLVVMKDNCNDDFYHAVHAGDSDEDRVSLVLKKALDRNGKKGHGQQGQGRRSRRKLNVSSSSGEGGSRRSSSRRRRR